MTIVIARTFGRRVAFFADTMISDAAKGREDAIPGRLKAIVLSPSVSVAYAGHAEPALAGVRRANEALARIGELEAAMRALVETAADTNHEVEYLLASHSGGEPDLRKITRRGVTANVSDAFLGDPAVVRDVLEIAGQQRADAVPDLEISSEELQLWNGFSRLFIDKGIRVREAVGGIPTYLVASPYGHTYQRGSVVSAWDSVDLAVGLTPAHLVARRSGETEWRFIVVSCRLRGVGVLGMGVPQAGLGFIHAPILSDDPRRIVLQSAGSGAVEERRFSAALSEAVEEAASEVGGGVEELDG